MNVNKYLALVVRNVSNNLDLSNNSIVCYVPKDDNFEIKN